MDLRDNADCLPSRLNLPESTARTAALIGIFNSFPGDVPVNGGSMWRMRVDLRKNCCVGIPVPPASCSLATANLASARQTSSGGRSPRSPTAWGWPTPG